MASALWVLGLAASVVYLVTTSDRVQSNLDRAVSEYRAQHEPSEPAPPDGANMQEIRKAWEHGTHARERHFNERLPSHERGPLLAGEDRLIAEQRAYDAHGGTAPPPTIEGVYLEPAF